MGALRLGLYCAAASLLVYLGITYYSGQSRSEFPLSVIRKVTEDPTPPLETPIAAAVYAYRAQKASITAINQRLAQEHMDEEWRVRVRWMDRNARRAVYERGQTKHVSTERTATSYRMIVEETPDHWQVTFHSQGPGASSMCGVSFTPSGEMLPDFWQLECH